MRALWWSWKENSREIHNGVEKGFFTFVYTVKRPNKMPGSLMQTCREPALCAGSRCLRLCESIRHLPHRQVYV